MKKKYYPHERKEIDNLLTDRLNISDQEVDKRVEEIINRVREAGDSALLRYTSRFDGVDLAELTVSEAEIKKAYTEADEDFLEAIREARARIKDFHQKQLQESWFSYQNGSLVGQLINPLQRIGAYVPGGTAGYPSSVLMTVIPAQVAGVEEIVAVSPPAENGSINPYTLVALREAGVDEIYKIGGAQAVAALAYGTETIVPVDKIVGPGNIYVTVAKKKVYGRVDIDMLAGPSEVLILADESANPEYIAADLLSQAEHDPRAVAVLVTTSECLGAEVENEIEEQLAGLERREIAEKALADGGLIIVVEDMNQGIELVNRFAPEHFEMVVKNPMSYLGYIKNAGAIFLGENSPEPLGDYMAGPNHVLPTGGTARYASPLNTGDFLKKSSIIYYQQQELEKVEKKIRHLAELEGLTAHSKSIEKRFGTKSRGD